MNQTFENYNIGFNDLSKEDFEKIKCFNFSEFKHLYICGSTGVGKTHLARAVQNLAGTYSDNWGTYDYYKFIEISEFYWLMQDYIFPWKNVNKDLLPEWEFKTLKRSKGIILDDLGTEITKDPEAIEFGFRELIEKSKAKIIITANIGRKSFVENYGSKIASRFFDKRLCQEITIKGKRDYRIER